VSRRHDVRRFKRHRTYTTAELAATARVTLTTISNWRREGLQSIDDRRPYLYAGHAIIEFLTRKNKPRQPMTSGQIYCVACKSPCEPAGGVVFLLARTAATGDLRGTCPSCGRTIFRRVRMAEAEQKATPLILRNEETKAPIGGNGDHPHTLPNTGSPA
jgi:hypothetical protein